MMDWVVEYFDADEGVILEEIYVGLSSADSLNARINRQLSSDERLVVACRGWTVRAIAVDNVVD